MDHPGEFQNDYASVYDSHDLTFGARTYMMDTNNRRINGADYARLNKQNDMINPIIGLFHEDHAPHDGSLILDVACGPGGWIRDVARLYPNVRLIGIDNNKLAIKYAKEHEATKHNQHVAFEIADITERFNCHSNIFDFIYLRFLVDAVPKTKWVEILLECFRVLKPGGCIRLVESEAGWIPSSAESKMAQSMDLLLEALWTYEKSFSRHAIAISPMLPAFLEAARFSNISVYPYLLNWSYGKELHQSVLENHAVSLQELRAVFRKTNIEMRSLTDKEFDCRFNALYSGALAEANLPNYRAFWPLVSVLAWKPIAPHP